MNEEYFKNIKPYLIKLDVNLNRLYFAFDVIDALFFDANFGNSFIENSRKRFEEKTLSDIEEIFFDSSLVDKPNDLKHLVEEFDKLFDDNEFKQERFHEHKNEIILSLLLTHHSYWAIPIGEVSKVKKLKKDTTYHDLSSQQKELFELQELAQIISVLVSYQEKGQKEHSLQGLTIEFGNNKARLSSPPTKSWIIDALEIKLAQSNLGEIGNGVGLVIEYFRAKEAKNYNSLKVLLKEIIKRDAFKVQSPLVNKAIADISLLIRHYLQCHLLIPETKLLSSTFLRFMCKLFDILGIEVSEFEVASQNEIEQLKKNISGRLKKLRTSSRKKLQS